MAERQARTKAVMDTIDPVTRMAMEGLRPGAYVRIRLSGELVQAHSKAHATAHAFRGEAALA